jgi:hypothetical protein
LSSPSLAHSPSSPSGPTASTKRISRTTNYYYYNGRLLAAGLPLQGIHHPGTPVQLLAAALIRTIGNDTEQTQAVLNAGYLIAGLLSAAAIAIFILLLPATSAGVLLLSGATVIASPPFLTHFNYFGSDSFLIAATLPALALIWSALTGFRPFSERLLVGTGVLLGLATTIKLTALPVLLATSLAVLPPLWRKIRHGPLPRRSLLALPLAAAASFVLCTLPIASRYPELFQYIFSDLIFPTNSFISVVSAVRTLHRILFVVQELPVFAAIIAASALSAPGMWVWHRFIAHGKPQFDYALFFLLLLLIVFLHGISKISLTTELSDPGVITRRMVPSYLVLPSWCSTSFLV